MDWAYELPAKIRDNKDMTAPLIRKRLRGLPNLDEEGKWKLFTVKAVPTGQILTRNLQLPGITKSFKF
ncbi:MAG: hypothetical protein A2293_11555 [Elusimicrobia bacterium RIFOXYB2_FULL_49_7]|nr:MAG: hypothetical protein A2293_11555 [Elusimicrobia bacterium RIFOXYB2_FULL_49_7]